MDMLKCWLLVLLLLHAHLAPAQMLMLNVAAPVVSGSTFSTLINDTFIRGNETPIASPWLTVNSVLNCNNGSNSIRLASNKFGAVQGNDCGYYYTGISPLANQWMRIELAGLASTFMGPTCRYDTTNGYFYAVAVGNNTAYVASIQSDGKHDYFNFAFTSTAGTSVGLECTGTNPVHLNILRNGSSVNTYDDSAATRLQSGGIGIYGYDSGSGSIGQAANNATGGSL